MSIFDMSDEDIMNNYYDQLFSGVTSGVKATGMTKKQKLRQKFIDEKSQFHALDGSVRNAKNEKRSLARQIAIRMNPGVDVITQDMIRAAKETDEFKNRTVGRVNKARASRQSARSELGQARSDFINERDRINNMSNDERLNYELENLINGQSGLNQNQIEASFQLGLHTLQDQFKNAQAANASNKNARGLLRSGIYDASRAGIDASASADVASLAGNLSQFNKNLRQEARQSGIQGLGELYRINYGDYYNKENMKATEALFKSNQAAQENSMAQNIALSGQLASLSNQEGLTRPYITSKGKIKNPNTNLNYSSGVSGGRSSNKSYVLGA